MGEKRNMMQVCVTGATGFIGRQLVEALAARPLSVRILTRHDKPPVPGNVEVIKGDLTKADCPLGRFLSGCDVLFHCAGEKQSADLMRRMALS